MKKKVLTITLNPAYDLVGFCPRIGLGDVNLIKTTGLHAAGKGINVARVLSDLDLDVIVSGFLGNENQTEFIRLFEERKWKNAFQKINGRTRINIKLTEQDGEVTDLNFSGFTVSQEQWNEFTRHTLSLYNEVDLISVNGSLPDGVTPEMFEIWLTQLTANGIKVIFDSSRDALSAGLVAKPWLIKPNNKELAMWAGKSLETLDEIIDAALRLVKKGIENVVVSLGSQGAVWVTATEIWLAKPPVCPVVSTVGAGDSMVAGIMYGYLTDQSIAATLCLSSAIAALSVGQTNVGIPDRQALDQMIDRIHLITMT